QHSFLLPVYRLPPRCTLVPYATLFRSNRPPASYVTCGTVASATQTISSSITSGESTVTAVRISPTPTTSVTGTTTTWEASNDGRSEEHTSELQSRVDLVCRLLLEKKNN